MKSPVEPPLNLRPIDSKESQPSTHARQQIAYRDDGPERGQVATIARVKSEVIEGIRPHSRRNTTWM